MSQFKCLSPDGQYNFPDRGINGFSDRAQKLKEQFLRDARSLLKQTQQILTHSGWSEYLICANPAGVAVSGDMFADFWTPADPFNIVYCTIGASVVHFGGRKDGVIIMARKEKRELSNQRQRSSKKAVYRTTWMGINQWIDPGMNSRELAAQLLKIACMQEGMEPSSLPGCVYHSTTSGSIPVPPGHLRNREDALAWSAALGHVIEAGQTDAAAHAERETYSRNETAAGQMTLFELFEDSESQGGNHV